MKPERVAEGIYQIRAVAAKVTALIGDGGIVLVDAGGPGSLGSIAGGLKTLGCSTDRVKLVVLTHDHPDHSGGLRRLVDATSARVAVHRLDAGIVGGKEPFRSPFANPVVAGLTRPLIRPFRGGPVDVDYQLEDGEHLPVKQEIRVIHTPGHTAGSICLYVAPQRVLIVGDALQHRRRRLGLPAASVSQDLNQARESLKGLLTLDLDTICFSHFPPLHGDAREKLRELVERTG